MRAAEDTVVTFPIKTKLVCSACGAPGEGSCRCGAAYVTPGERAEAAVRAHPEKSDRAIAEEIGVSTPTVGRARKRTTVTDVTVAKRTGKDGKARKQPKPRGHGLPPAEQEAKAREIVRPMVEANLPIDYRKVGQQHGIAHVTVEKATRIERVLLHERQVTVDIDTLSKSAKEKLDAAIRQERRRLDAEHAARMQGVDEEVRQRVIADSKEHVAMLKEMQAKARSDESLWREMIDAHRAIFTADQFKTILMCLHPDGERTAEKLAEAFRLFNGKKLQLTKAR